MKDPIYLKRVTWSPMWAQALCGFTEDGEFVITEAVFTTCKENTYTTSEGQEYIVLSWQPDGSGYKDSKEK